MINVEVISDEGIVVVAPAGPLEEADFQRLAGEVDAFSEDKGRLKGIIIHTRTFPGWEDFSAFLSHMKFVKEHHKQIPHVAIVTDSRAGDIGPAIAKHFVSAELKHFPYDNLAEAKKWVLEAG